ncbi:catalase family protein [Roseiconus lacunae]|uniref:catalase n=1 Tax=Roseiconus lacunae TaxID=2605694 RepID=UPI001E2A9C05|nr:catalase [Roseiconus lacunae]MCD0462374.1 catalase [Roseiconus lacunae]
MTNTKTHFESIDPAEAQLTKKLRGLLAGAQKANPESAKRRGQHPKAHGCVWATLEISNQLPSNLQTPVFQPGRSYDALVRFSNGRTFNDTDRDAHGMAIKLLGVEGPRAMDEGEQLTQDFVLADSPNFFAKDVAHMLDFVVQTAPEAAGGGGKTAAELAATTHPHVATFTKHAMASPMDMTYWSQTPYLLGQHAVKYIASPVHDVDDSPVTTGTENFLHEAMVARLSDDRPLEYQLSAQVISDEESVEDATEIWQSQPTPVATLTIAPQTFDTPERHRFCEQLTFTPWHAHQAHRPLGGINRARKGIYLDSKRLREEKLGVQFREPVAKDKS